MSNTYIFDAEGVAGSLSDFGDFRNLEGGGTVKFTADGYHISNSSLILQQAVWKITVDGTIGVDHNSGLTVFSSPGSTLTVGATGTISGSGNGVDSNGAMNIVNNGLIIGEGQAISMNNYATAVTITNNGTIQGSSDTDFAIDVYGNGKHTIINSGFIYNGIATYRYLSDDTVTNTGAIFGNIALGDGKDTVTNKGYIDGTVYLDEGNDTFTNSGQVTYDVQGYTGNDTITNTGKIFGDLNSGGDNDTVSNTGTVSLNVGLGSGDDKFDNKGEVQGTVYMDEGNDTFTNSGHVVKDVQGFDGNDKITNTGIIDSYINAGIGVDTVTNSGTVGDGIDLWYGDDTLTNKGIIYTGVNGNTGNDTLTNSGTIFGDVHGGDDNDKLTNTGTITGKIYMDAGDDTFTGGSKAETVVDSAGKDTYNLGAGNDTFVAVNVAEGSGDANLDHVDGGTNSSTSADGFWGDIYDASDATNALKINLDNVAHSGVDGDATSQAANLATGSDVGADSIKGFEFVYGGSGNDYIWGTAGVENLQGRDGDDFLFGLAGKDTLDGGDGADTLVGGVGADTLFGGTNDGKEDHFVFTSYADSTVALTGRDNVKEFEDGIDKIVFAGMGAVHLVAVDPVDQAFDGTAGALRILKTSYGWTIQVDKGTDHKADMAIDVSDHSHAIVWDASDFLFH